MWRGALAMGLVLAGVAMGQERWFEWQPVEDGRPSSVDCAAWLDAPAGRRGAVLAEGDRLVFEDGTPVKFWGVNICNARVAPSEADAVAWAGKLAKYGVNAVRFHKFTWHGAREGIGSAERSTDLVPEGLARMDRFVHELRGRGIYYSWSHIYGHRVRPGDRERLLAYEEVLNSGSGHLKGSTIGLVNFAPDLQDLSIELTINLLNHRNPHTGLRYADDPALAVVELQNEDNIFFPTARDAIEACPTYKRLICEQFSDWLRAKYGSHEALVAAWGERAIDAYPEHQTDERLDRRNIYPIAHFWWFGPEGLAKQEAERGTRRRLLDTARFLYETQNAFYDRFVAAIRATGYRGAIVGSCWQAGSGVSHYYNLHADARVGVVDRHNYHGGPGHDMRAGRVHAEAMVDAPGSGLLSSGFMQVAGRPFSLSEWIAMAPNEFVAEAAPIVAAYGLGLQGWDASFAFASNFPGHPDRLDAPNVYNADSPLHLGLYPALFRMVRRGDLAEAPTVAQRRVDLEALIDGRLDFDETVVQEGDVKTIRGDIDPALLAVGRVAVEFDPSAPSVPTASLDRHREPDNALRSATGQLAWTPGPRGFFTIHARGTRGVVGFVGGLQKRLGVVEIECRSPFAVVLVSSLDPDRGVDDARRLLVTAVARGRNTGQRYSDDGRELLDPGGPPLLLEGVRFSLRIARDVPATLVPLDQSGVPVGEGVAGRAADGMTAWDIDSADDRAIWYEVRFGG